MILKKVIVKTTTEGADLVSSILIENGCTGTTIVDKTDVIIATKDETKASELTRFYPKNVLVVGVIEHEDPTQALKDINQTLEYIKKNSDNLGELSIRTEDVNSEHWSDIWQDYYKAYIVGKIKICGTWQRQTKSLFKIPLYLNPGAAFGTGQHPTTELVIMSMQKFINLKDKTVIDVGCGSGILGLCALKLGAKHATLLDIDDVAVDSALLNAQTNNLKDKVSVIKKDIIYKKDTTIKGDVIFININSQINYDYAKNVNNNINPNGIIILSGILPEYREKIKNVYEEQGFKVISELTLDNWITYVMRKV